MGARAGGGGTPFAANGSQRTMDIYNAIVTDADANFVSGAGTPTWCHNAIVNGQRVASVFPNGSTTGPDGIASNAVITNPHVFFAPAAAIRDQYCTYSPFIRLRRPLVAEFNRFAVWEVEADMTFRLPGGALAGDFGLILMGNTGTTGYGNDFTSGAGIGNPGQLGIGIIAQGATNELHVVARNAASGGFTKNISTGVIANVPGGVAEANDRLRRLKIRLESATVGADAKASFFCDNVLMHSDTFRPAASGGTMPHMADVPTWLGAWRCYIRNANNNVSGAVLAYAHWRISAAASVAAMG